MCEVRVQCKNKEQRWANHPDTLWRVASGPGADLSCLRQVPAPGPRKGDGANGHFSSVELSSIFCGCSAN